MPVDAVADEVDRGREDFANDALWDVLTGHERCVDECVQSIGRRVGMDGAQEATASVQGTGQFEGLSSPHLAYHDHVRPHGECHLDEVSEGYRSPSANKWSPRLVIGPVDQRNMKFADLFTTSDTVFRGNTRNESGQEGCLPGTGRSEEKKIHQALDHPENEQSFVRIEQILR